MRCTKRLFTLVLALVMCSVLALPAFAHDVPDLSRTGSVSFTMLCGDSAVGGGSLTLYRVGDVAEDDGNYSFALSDAYADSGVSLEDITDTALAASLAEYTTANKPEGITVEIGADGTATASNLTLGLYLVMQNQPASGYEAIAPFLVSVPMYDEEDGVYVYEVDAQPKMSELTKLPPAATTTTTETTVSDPGTPAVSATTLPQTGQLNWPVPVMTVLGLVLFLVGWGLRFGKQRKPYGA